MKKREIQIRQLEIRQALNALAGGEEWTAENEKEATELRAELTALDSRLAALLSAESDTPETETETTTPENRELDGLMGRCNLGTMVEAVVGNRSQSGAEAELQKHFSLDGNFVPVEMLAENRAAAVISGSEPATLSPVIPQIFPDSVMAFCGIARETVPSGERGYPVLSTGATVIAPAAGAEAAESSGTFAVTTLTAKRLQTGFSYRREDSATFAFLDAALRENLSAALSDGLDNQVLNRAGQYFAPKTALAAPSAKTTAAEYLSHQYAAVDGKYAPNVGSIKTIVGQAIYAAMGSTIISSSDDISVAEKISAIGGGLRVSSHVPAYANNFQACLLVKGPAQRNAVVAMWRGIELVVDPITQISKGEIKLTAIMLYDLAILRADAFIVKTYRTA